MSGTLIRLGLLAAVVMLPASAEVNQSWEKLVETVKVGKSVVVKRMNSVQIEGKLLAISADSITLSWDGGPEVIVRADVLRVRYANIRRRHTLLGMAIGAGIGAVLFAKNSLVNSGGGAWIGVGAGAAVGGALTIGEPLYEAPGGLKRK